MHSTPATRRSLLSFVSALVILTVMMASLLVVVPPTEQASAQGGVTSLVVWDISGGITNNPKTWRFARSNSAANDLGSHTAAQPGFDDSGWVDVETFWYDQNAGPDVANHFRKEFTLDEIGVELFEIEAMQIAVHYDDTMVMYLNGVEVYRSIRGNLDPTYTYYPANTDIPHNPVDIPWGGWEFDEPGAFTDIPNTDGLNSCQLYGADCPLSPYGDQNPPAIPLSLLNEDGVNVWAVTTWNRIGGRDGNGVPQSPGSRDSGFDHQFELLIDENAIPPNPIFINEVMAANDQSLEINIDDDPELETPDWFELHNVSNDPVNMAGWTISDNSAGWTFPSITIPANGYLIVAASDEDRTDLPIMQTNFKLSREGDMLRLTNPDGFLADEYAVMPRQFDDNSYGRPNNSGTPTYLATYTPGAANGAAGDGYDPILRPFKNRIYNQGETVSHSIDAFDPDGDALSYSVSPIPAGLSVDSTGEITGTATAAGTTFSTVTVTDSDGDSASQVVQWVVLEEITGAVPIVLSEYNAVATDRELIGGDGSVGNGGDWFEFLVIEDQLDLRGYRFEFYDNKGADDQLRLAATATVGTDPDLARAPAGTLLTVSEANADDLGFDGQSDWHVNLVVTNTATGPYFGAASPGAVFNSTRSAQMVLIKDASGTVVTPLSGETEAWDTANGGVSGGEVMALCINPTAGMSLDPVTAYSDTGASTFGEPNECTNVDPANVDGQVISQDLSALRATATLGGGNGDANCDLRVTVADAVLAAQYSVGNRTDGGTCAFGNGPDTSNGELFVDAVDMNRDGDITVFDAVTIARCNVGLEIQWCPE